MAYDLVISNSLLHHLPEPGILWDAVKRLGKPGARVVVMDLARPESEQRAWELVETYSGQEPTLLKTDFHHSLCAAYRPEEVREGLVAAGLGCLRVERVSDRHWLVTGSIG